MSLSKSPADPFPQAQPPERRIVDESGIAWSVTEVRVWDASGRSTSSLVAAHQHGFRRIWHFPADWAELADAQLAELVSKPFGKMVGETSQAS